MVVWKSVVDAWENKFFEEMSEKMMDLLMEMSRWPIKMYWRAGKDHVIADSLGRAAVEDPSAHSPILDKLPQEFPRLSGGEAGEFVAQHSFNKISAAMAESEEKQFADMFEEANKDKKYKQVIQSVKNGLEKSMINTKDINSSTRLLLPSTSCSVSFLYFFL